MHKVSTQAGLTYDDISVLLVKQSYISLRDCTLVLTFLHNNNAFLHAWQKPVIDAEASTQSGLFLMTLVGQ